MKKLLFLFPLLLLGALLLLPAGPETPTETVRGTVVDRAMEDGLPYIGIQPDTGEGLCIYCRSGSIFPEQLSLGSRVEVQYETVPFPSGSRYFAVTVTILE